MIQLVKTQIPDVLRENHAAWTLVLLDHNQAGTKPTDGEKSRYRHSDIKNALIAETSGKCAYCESKLRHITYGDVEHIVPKSVRIERTFDWNNLTLACDVCNTNKGSHFGNHEDLVDPYAGDPSVHLNFVGVVVLPKPGSNPGVATESTLGLNRMPLIERRTERLTALNRQLHLIVAVEDQNIKAILRRDLVNNELAGDKEYAAMARVFINDQLQRLDQKK